MFSHYRLKDKKAAIGYTYEDSSEGQKDGNQSGSEEEEEEDDIETFDLGMPVDVKSDFSACYWGEV